MHIRTEIRDYCGQVPLNQIDSINFGLCNELKAEQNLETSINIKMVVILYIQIQNHMD